MFEIDILKVRMKAVYFSNFAFTQNLVSKLFLFSVYTSNSILIFFDSLFVGVLTVIFYLLFMVLYFSLDLHHDIEVLKASLKEARLAAASSKNEAKQSQEDLDDVKREHQLELDKMAERYERLVCIPYLLYYHWTLTCVL